MIYSYCNHTDLTVVFLMSCLGYWFRYRSKKPKSDLATLDSTNFKLPYINFHPSLQTFHLQSLHQGPYTLLPRYRPLHHCTAPSFLHFNFNCYSSICQFNDFLGSNLQVLPLMPLFSSSIPIH